MSDKGLGIKFGFEYNVRNWVTRVRNYTDAGATLYDARYYYADGTPKDSVGNPLKKTEDFGTGLYTTHYTYDRFYRLGSEQRVNPQASIDQDLRYAYDKADNRTGRNDLYAPLNITYSYDSNNKLTSASNGGTQTATFGYTGGSINSVTGTLLGTWSMSYDDAGRLKQVTYPISGGSATDSLYYNALGQRYKASFNGTVRRYDYNGNRVLDEMDAAGYRLARYTTGDGSFFSPLLHEWRSSSTSRFPVLDMVGSARRLVDASGATTDTYSLDAYGRTLSSSGTTENPYRFGAAWGYRTDTIDSTHGSKLLQLGARYYWPEIGRFIQQDPIGAERNAYAYAGDNPVTGIDPEGLWRRRRRGFGQWLRDQGRAIRDAMEAPGHMAVGYFSMDPANLPTFSQRNPGLGDLQNCIGRGQGFDPTPAFGQLANAGFNAAFMALAGGLEIRGPGFASEAKLLDHFGRHGAALGYTIPAEYLAAAQRLVSGADELVEMFVRPGGDILFYKYRTNEFAVLSSSGVLRTYFAPKDGLMYFLSQIGY